MPSLLAPAMPSPLAPAMPSRLALAPVAPATPCRPAIAMPCQLALATNRPAMSGPCRPAPAMPCPAGHGRAEPPAGSARPEAPAGPVAPAAPAKTAAPAVPTRPAAPTAPAGPAGAAVRAVIGDQLRMPIMWCEMGSCISWHADPAALGEADTRARAIAAGWRIDALGRLACPRCQQNDPRYRAARPVVPRDRYTAIARTSRIPAAPRSSRDPARAASGSPPPSRAELEWHHDSPADEAMPAGRYAGNPAGTSIPAARSSMRSGPGELAAAARRHLGQAGGHGEDLMIAERAHANPAGAMTLTGR